MSKIVEKEGNYVVRKAKGLQCEEKKTRGKITCASNASFWRGGEIEGKPGEKQKTVHTTDHATRTKSKKKRRIQKGYQDTRNTMRWEERKGVDKNPGDTLIDGNAGLEESAQRTFTKQGRSRVQENGYRTKHKK